MDSNYYIEKRTGFYLKSEEELVPTSIFQPTPAGIKKLCQHYSRKYSIDLACVDLRDYVAQGDNLRYFFEHLRTSHFLLDLEEGQSRGLILSHGQFHVIPLMITKRNDTQYMFVFDSSSGARIKGYFGIANIFGDFQFCLNSGTRQADEGSCMTDAICILKEALMIPDLLELIQSKQIIEHEAFRTGKFFSCQKPANFLLFKMPEQLLLTAQRTIYLEQANADLSVILRGGRSLQEYRDDFLLPVVLKKNEERATTPINGYLYLKSKEHKIILDGYSARESCDELDALDTGSCSLLSEERINMYGSPYPKFCGL